MAVDMQNVKPRVAFENGKAMFSDSDGVDVFATAAQLRRLYHVRSGSDLDANDEEFWLIELEHALLLIPNEREDIAIEFLQAWKNDIEAGEKAYEAICALPPASWRIKRLGFFPGTQMKCTVLLPAHLRDLEGWRVLEPLSIEIYCKNSQ